MPDYQGPATLSEILQHHLEAGTITRKQVELCASVKHSTVQRWVDGETEPGLKEWCGMVRCLPDEVVRDMLGMALYDSAFEAAPRPEADTSGDDANGDGRCDSEDAPLHQIDVIREGAELARELMECAGGLITGDRMASLLARANRVKQCSEAALRCAGNSASSGARMQLRRA